MRSVTAGLCSDARRDLLPNARVVEAGFAHQEAFFAAPDIPFIVSFIERLPGMMEGQLGDHVFNVIRQPA